MVRHACTYGSSCQVRVLYSTESLADTEIGGGGGRKEGEVEREGGDGKCYFLSSQPTDRHPVLERAGR